MHHPYKSLGGLILLSLLISVSSRAQNAGGEDAPLILYPDSLAYALPAPVGLLGPDDETLQKAFSEARSRTNPDPDALKDLSLAFLSKGNPENAWVCAERALSAMEQPDPELLALLAIAQQRSGSPDLAAQTWLTLGQRDESDPLPGLRAVRGFIENGRVDEAREETTRLLSLHPQDAGTRHMAGVLAYLAKDYRAAWRHFSRAAVLQKTWVEPRIMLAEITALDGELEESIGWIRAAVERENPENPAVPYEKLESVAILERYHQYREQLTAMDLVPARETSIPMRVNAARSAERSSATNIPPPAWAQQIEDGLDLKKERPEQVLFEIKQEKRLSGASYTNTYMNLDAEPAPKGNRPVLLF